MVRGRNPPPSLSPSSVHATSDIIVLVRNLYVYGHCMFWIKSTCSILYMYIYKHISYIYDNFYKYIFLCINANPPPIDYINTNIFSFALHIQIKCLEFLMLSKNRWSWNLSLNQIALLCSSITVTTVLN